jgi:hypothetical protein
MDWPNRKRQLSFGFGGLGLGRALLLHDFLSGEKWFQLYQTTGYVWVEKRKENGFPMMYVGK